MLARMRRRVWPDRVVTMTGSLPGCRAVQGGAGQVNLCCPPHGQHPHELAGGRVPIATATATHLPTACRVGRWGGVLLGWVY